MQKLQKLHEQLQIDRWIPQFSSFVSLLKYKRKERRRNF